MAQWPPPIYAIAPGGVEAERGENSGGSGMVGVGRDGGGMVHGRVRDASGRKIHTCPCANENSK